MANDLNQCQFIGRLGQDPEMRYMQDNTAVANISIAVGRSWKDKNTGEKKQDTEWVRVCAFGRLAEVIGEYLKKGSQVFISGRMRTRKWEDKEGKERYTTEVIAETLQMLGGPKDGGEKGAQRSAPAQQQRATTQQRQPETDFDDDIPF